MSEEFPSKYLKSAAIKGHEVKVIMANCQNEEVGQKNGQPDIKPVLYFKDKEKGLVLNKTNATIISDFYGDDTADWFDQPLILYVIRTEFQGQPKDGLRVRIPTAKDNRQPERSVPRQDPVSSGPSDEIPF